MSMHTQAGGKIRKAVVSLRGQTDSDVIFEVVRITGVASGSGSTTIIADAQVPSNCRVRVLDWAITSNDVIWTSGGSDTVSIQDTSGTPIVFVTIAKASLPTATSGHTSVLGTSTKGQGLATGGGLGKGIVFSRSATFAGAALLTIELLVAIMPDTSITYA